MTVEPAAVTLALAAHEVAVAVTYVAIAILLSTLGRALSSK